MSNKEKEQFKKRFGVFRIEEAELERMFKQEALSSKPQIGDICTMIRSGRINKTLGDQD
jgi:hypothetical protein